MPVLEDSIEVQRRQRLLQQLEMFGEGREMSASQNALIDEVAELCPLSDAASPLVNVRDVATRIAIRTKLTAWAADEPRGDIRSRPIERILRGDWPQ